MMCELCQDRGYLIDDNKTPKKCICTVKRELEATLGNLIQYHTNKNIDSEVLHQDLMIIEGSDLAYYSLIKSFLIKTFFTENINKASYYFGTGYSITENYLNNTLSPLFDIPYMFLDLTKFQSNKIMGENVLYTLQQRKHNQTISWCYIGNLKQNDISDIYHPDLTTMLYTLKSISLKGYNI